MSPADQAKLDAETAKIPEPGWATFAQVNGLEERARGVEEQNALACYAGGNAIWNQRQAWFDQQALEAIRAAHATDGRLCGRARPPPGRGGARAG